MPQFALRLFRGYVDFMQGTVSGSVGVRHLYIYTLFAFYAKAPHRDGAPFTGLAPKCQQPWVPFLPRGGSVGNTANSELKGTDFYQTPQSCEGRRDICFFFFFPRGKRVRWHLVCRNKATRVEMITKRVRT